MKKSLLLSVFMIFAIASVAATYPASYYTLAGVEKPGDVNNDGVCNAADVTALYNWILNNDNSALKNGDQNRDNVINAGDVTYVYNIILGDFEGYQSVYKMNEYKYVYSSIYDPHLWQASGEVIYITLDGVEENMYVIALYNGVWTLKDINGSSKAGFKESGTLKAIWVRNGNWTTDQVGDIAIPYDYATGSGTYKCDGKLIAVNLNLQFAETKIRLPESDASIISSMSYCTHVTNVFNINRLCNGEIGEFVLDATTTAPKQKIGNVYYVFGKHYDIDANNKTVLHVTRNDGRSYRATASHKLGSGDLFDLYSREQVEWARDFTMRYHNEYEATTNQMLYPGTSKTIYLNVGAEITFFPQEGGVTMSDGTTNSRSSTHPSIVNTYASSTYNSTTCKALSVGETDVTFSYTSRLGDTFNFYIHFVVVPNVWLAGSYNNKPALYCNNILKYSSLGVDATRIDKVFLRQGSAYIKTYDANNPTATPYVMRSSNPLHYGSFSTRIQNKPMDLFFVATDGSIWYTYGNNVYMDGTLISTYQGTFCDLKQDETYGHMWLSGYDCANNSKSSSNDYAWLRRFTSSSGSATAYLLSSDQVTTEVGGYQPNGRTHTGPRSPHFGKFRIQYNFVLINGFDVEEHAYRSLEGNIYPSYYTYDKTYTYDATNNFLRQNSVKYPRDDNFFFEDQVNERVFFIDTDNKLKYHYLRSNQVNVVNSSIPSIYLLRYCDGIVYAYAYGGKILSGTTAQFFSGTYKVIQLNEIPSEAKDMFIQISVY